MRWEELTWVDFPKAVKSSKGVCILTLGVLEKHGNHLPLGTDVLNVHKLACLAAEKESAVVFPQYYFGQIYEAQHMQGTIAIKPQLMLELLENVCDEIGRNGFRKILIVNGHGGNISMLDFFLQLMLYRKKNYVVYLAGWWPHKPEDQEYYRKLMETKEHGHACECETSYSLANFPELVKMNLIPKRAGHSLDRLKHLENIRTPLDWFARYPDHYAGDARPASKEKGEKLKEKWVEHLVRIIKIVKDDETLPALYEQFFSRIEH
ncbi:MAG: creatininase family protein [Thermoproteota archaeon]